MDYKIREEVTPTLMRGGTLTTGKTLGAGYGKGMEYSIRQRLQPHPAPSAVPMRIGDAQ